MEHSRFPSRLMLGPQLLIEEPILRQCLCLMDHFILLKCYILHSFRNSSSHPPRHNKANKDIKIPSITSGSSSSQKHLQNHQQRLHGSGGSGDGGNLQGFPGSKNQLPHSLPNQQRQQMENQNISHQARQLDSELGGEDSPSTADSRVSRPNTSLYGQNLMAIHPANFALMNPTSMGGARSASGNTGEKNPQQSQTQVSKGWG
ncbi:hypothetical protein OIU78_004523 [Salix suchowensis]|nr:hypothetical protein OIU78_004523 [Salix suchowensis]